MVNFLVTGCDPVRVQDRSCQVSRLGGSVLESEAFASGYFPASLAEPVEVCEGSAYPIISSVEAEWYPEQWHAACEPSFATLAQQDAPPEFALRFSLIPSFSGSLFISVIESDGEHILVAKGMSGAGGYDPGVIGRSTQTVLSEEQVEELLALLEDEALFEQPPYTCDFGFDGSQWLFERVDENGYSFVQRWSPNGGPAYSVGRHLIELADWPTD